MLSLWFTPAEYTITDERYVFNPEAWFDDEFGEEYIVGDIERQMIKDIDKCEVISKNNVVHEWLGSMSPFDLSGTVKTLILVKNDPAHIFNGSFMGDLAVPWLLDIGRTCDRIVRFGYLPKFEEPFEIRIENDGRIVSTWQDLLWTSVKFLSVG